MEDYIVDKKVWFNLGNGNSSYLLKDCYWFGWNRLVIDDYWDLGEVLVGVLEYGLVVAVGWYADN